MRPLDPLTQAEVRTRVQATGHTAAPVREPRAAPRLIARSSLDARVTARGGALGWWLWGLAVAFVVYTFSFQTAYSIVNPTLQQDFGLSISQVATIAAIYTWAFALCQFVGGALLDRLGSRQVLPLSIALVTMGVFVFASADSYAMLLLSQIIVAAGSCTAFVGAGYVGGHWFGMARFSVMFGLVELFTALTSAFALTVFDSALSTTPWRTVFNVYGFVGLVLLIVSAIYIRNPRPVVGEVGAGIGAFCASVLGDIAYVGRVGHVWIASVTGAMSFGVMLALGLVWMPKLLMVHGLDQSTAGVVSSLLWFGSASGNAVFPSWSSYLRSRRVPLIVGGGLMLACLLALLYVPDISLPLAASLCFAIGVGSASHMLAFSTVADVMRPSQIGTFAAIVNGIAFIVGGILISRPGVRIGWGVDAGIEPGSLELAQYASWPLLAALAIACALPFYMKETYPRSAEAAG
jgi:MFS family permease